MAKGKSKGEGEKYNPKEEVRFEGGAILTASKSLGNESYEGGYPQTMQHHINRGGSGKSAQKLKGR